MRYLTTACAEMYIQERVRLQVSECAGVLSPGPVRMICTTQTAKMVRDLTITKSQYVEVQPPFSSAQ